MQFFLELRSLLSFRFVAVLFGFKQTSFANHYGTITVRTGYRYLHMTNIDR